MTGEEGKEKSEVTHVLVDELFPRGVRNTVRSNRIASLRGTIPPFL